MRRNEKLLLALSEVSEEYIPSVEPKGSRLNRTAVCSGLFLAAMAALILLSHIASALPVISPYIVFGEMGYESFMAYDISEITTGNPWNPDIELTALPVFKNLSYVYPIGREGFLTYLTENQLAAMAEETANALGVKITSTNVQSIIRARGSKAGIDDTLAQTPYLFKSVCDGTPLGVGEIKINIYGNGDIEIFFDGRLAIPDEYSADEEAKIKYVIQRFPDLFRFESPVIYSRAERNIYGELFASYYCYDGSEDYADAIVNYNLSSAFIYVGDASSSVIHTGTFLSAAEYLGDYPIISANEAQELLLDGKYITTVDELDLKDGRISADEIRKIDLIYMTGFVEYYQPYYRFYIEMGDEEWYRERQRPEGLKEYGVFYVPAVRGEYLTDFTLWDGTFSR